MSSIARPYSIRVLATRASSSSSSSDNGGLPSTSIVSIGGGFVAFAVSILTILSLLRVFRLSLAARRQRRAGASTTFGQLWEREGGFWGFITGLGGESAARGAGWIDVGRQRRWEEMERWERFVMARLEQEEEAKETPRMWEVGVREHGQVAEVGDNSECLRPLALTTSTRPDSTLDDHPTDLTLNLSLLILLPSQRSATPQSMAKGEGPGFDDEAEELPELVVGTTTVIPFIRPSLLPSLNGKEAEPGLEGTHTVAPDSSRTSEKEAEGESEEAAIHAYTLEYATPDPSASRRAVWEKTDSGWRMEGLDG